MFDDEAGGGELGADLDGVDLRELDVVRGVAAR